MPAPTRVLTNVWSVGKPCQVHRPSWATTKSKKPNNIFRSGTTIRRGGAETGAEKTWRAERFRFGGGSRSRIRRGALSAEKQESAEMKELREIRRLGQQAGEFPERKQNKIDG